MDVCLHLVVLSVPLFFFTAVPDALELSKQTVLAALASVAFMAWLGKAVAEKRFSLTRSWLHLIVILFGIGYLAISFLSQDRYLSFVGQLGQQAWSFATVGALILLYIVVVNRVRQTTQVYNLVFSFLASSSAVALYGLAQIWIHGFNTIGSFFSMAVYLAVPLVMAASLAFHGCRDQVCLLGSEGIGGTFARFIVWLTMASALAVLLVADFWPAWAAVLFGTVLMVGIGYLRTREVGRPSRLGIPAILVVVSILFLVIKTPIQVNVPGEVAPSMHASWLIAQQTLQAHPLFGSGPGTWVYDYAKYRNPLVNLSPFWNIRFDRGFSSFLTLLAAIGIIGTSLLLLLMVSAVTKSAIHLYQERQDDLWHAYLVVFCGWATMAFVLFVYNFNLAHQMAFWFLLALLGSLVTRKAFVWDARKNANVFGAMAIVFILSVVAGISVIWLAGQRFAAEMMFANAVSSYHNQKSLDEVLGFLAKAKTLNGWSDIYPRNQSQVKLLQVANTLQNHPNAEQLKQVNQLVMDAADLGLAARDMAPANVDNWSNLALIYQNVASFTKGADEFAIKNYMEASLLEPQNPVFLNEIGKLFILRSDAYKTQLQSPDKTKQAEAVKQVPENLKLALDWLKKSVQAKSDYFPAHYHLGLVYERQDRVKEAIEELTQAHNANAKDSGIVFELAILYYRNRQPDVARQLLEQIVKVEPSQANARWYLAALYEEAGRLPDAIAQMEELSRQMPDNATVAQKLAGLIQEQKNKTAPPAQPLPEPLKEDVKNQANTNPIKK